MLSTAQKVALAQVVSKTVCLSRGLIGRGPELVVTRGGAVWQLDLREGIDLSVYLLGAFEPSTVRCYSRHVKPGDVVLDIGANVGAHTLPLARLVGDAGRVIAFEPTRFAFRKLQRNLSLNPPLLARVSAVQAMLVTSSSTPLEAEIYSSWPLENADDIHPDHRGRLMDTSGAVATTLDAELLRRSIERVDFVKLDVDGYELQVLEGATETLRRHHPDILMELAPYVFAEKPGDFDAILRILGELGYRLHRVEDGKPIPLEPEVVRRRIPRMGGINVIATSSTAAPGG